MAWTEADIPSQAGRVAVVTGANSGIGWHTALELARKGAEVILTARTDGKGSDAVKRIKAVVPDARVRYELLDLASLKSVREFAGRVGSARNWSKIDLLVNNAGVMRILTRTLTEDGFETQMATNFLGPFALTMLLMPALLRSDSPQVTTVSSGAANMGLKRINFDDMQWENKYSPWNAYCQSKLADLLLMLELGRRSAEAGMRLVSNAAHPGFALTNLQTSGSGREMYWFEKLLALIMSQDAAHGAMPTLLAATSPQAGTGSYFGPENFFHMKGDPVAVELPKPALDEAVAKRLWAEAERLTGVRWVG